MQIFLTILVKVSKGYVHLHIKLKQITMSRTHYYEWQLCRINTPDNEDTIEVDVRFEVYDEETYKAAIPVDFENPDKIEWLTLSYIESNFKI